jgi:ribosomal protein L11 methyltransferase
MPVKNWLEVTVPAPPDAQEELLARLVMAGFEGFHIEETCINLYLSPDDSGGLDCLRGLAPSLSVRERCEGEWEEAWKRYYKPAPIGERLLIQPAWLECGPTDRAVYLNDPGMAFGTGLHASTKLCLEILESLNLNGKKVLDIGCGSGILGLCALLLGAESAVGVDIDPYAVRTAAENARLNGVDGRFSAVTGDYLTDSAVRDCAGGFDVVFSNIIADIIIPLAPILASRLQNGALWVSSGIIEHRLDDVLSAAENAGLAAQTVRVEDSWGAIQLRVDSW